MTLQELLDRLVELDANRCGGGEGLLDSAVLEAKEEEGSDLNNEGLEAQVRYLMARGMDEHHILEAAKDTVDCDEDVDD